MAGYGNLLVGGQFQVTAGLPKGIPGPPATVLGGSAAGPPINGSAWIEGPALIGSPLAYPLPRPTATLMLGRTKNYLAPETNRLPILMVSSRSSSPTPTDLLIGDPSGPVGLTATLSPSAIITVRGKTTYSATSRTTASSKSFIFNSKNFVVNSKTSFNGRSITTGRKVINGNTKISGSLSVTGNISSPTIIELKAKISSKKGFDIPHPTKDDHRLRYICVEGPAAEVYLRGKIKDINVILLPDYWKDLVDAETIGVTLTPIGVYQELFVDKIEWGTRIIIKNNLGGPIHCNFIVFAERKDTAKNIPEYIGLTPADYPGDNKEYTINGN